MSNNEVTPKDLDIRIRERMLRHGLLSEETVAKYVAALPDCEENSEPVSIPQPALGGRDDG